MASSRKMLSDSCSTAGIFRSERSSPASRPSRKNRITGSRGMAGSGGNLDGAHYSSREALNPIKL
jgi:hypothetical protein